MANKDQKRQKDNPDEKLNAENQKKGFQPPAPKPFSQFSNPNKFSGNSKGFGGNSSFHRRTPGGK
jgi:hypothetical protein